MSTVSERIKQVRLEASGGKMSMDEFGEALGVTRSVVVNWEDAENRLKNGVPDYVLRHISRTFHVSYNWLVTGEGEMLLQLSSDDLIERYMPNESELTKSIMKAFAKLPDEEWYKLRDMIDKIKNES